MLILAIIRIKFKFIIKHFRNYHVYKKNENDLILAALDVSLNNMQITLNLINTLFRYPTIFL